MAIDVHGVTAALVVNSLPFAKGSVTATSRGLNTTLVTEWITEAAGTLNAILARHGLGEDLGENEAELMKSGIKAYARMMCLQKREFPQEQVALYRDQWKEVQRTLRETPEDLGGSQLAGKRVQDNYTANLSGSAQSYKFDSDYSF